MLLMVVAGGVFVFMLLGGVGVVVIAFDESDIVITQSM
jgi:hypothetical protein